MTNAFYTATGTPSTGAFAASAPMRSEFDDIQAGFDKMPALTAGTAVVVNGAGTALANTVGSLALAGNFSTTGNFAVVLAASAPVTLALPGSSGTLATLAGTETLSNKTLVGVVLGTPISGDASNLTGTATGLTVGNATNAVHATTADSATTAVTATTVTTNANLTGPITSVGNATSIASQTGTGSKIVVDTSPTLVTPILGVATATSLNGNVFTAGTYTLTGGAGKTLTFSNSLTLAGTDATVMTFPGTSATIARTDAANTFTGIQTFSTPIAVGSVATMTATVGGGVPTPPNNTTTFLRGDGTFAVPAGGGTVNSGTSGQLTYYAASGTAVSGNANATIINGALTLGVAGSVVGTLALVNATSGSIVLAPPTGGLGSATLTLPDATDTLIGKATADVLTNKTYDTAGTGNVFKINGTGISAVSGSGAVVLVTSATLITPTLGVASATSINKMAITAPATSSTLAVADGKTATISNTLTFTGTDSSSVAFGSGGTVLYSGSVINQSSTGPTLQSFTSGSSATYTTPAGVKWIKVRMIGGGGGGGGVGLTTHPTGASGGTTIFNSVNANGGGGGGGADGSTAGSGGAGGTGGTGTANLRISGGPGANGTTVAPLSASGAVSPFGGNGWGSITATGGNAVANSGSGGGGTSGSGTNTGAAGGAGEYVELIIINPSGTYTYTVGASGAGGIGTGSGAQTGGAGGSGFIIVDEHYNY